MDPNQTQPPPLPPAAPPPAGDVPVVQTPVAVPPPPPVVAQPVAAQPPQPVSPPSFVPLPEEQVAPVVPDTSLGGTVPPVAPTPIEDVSTVVPPIPSEPIAVSEPPAPVGQSNKEAAPLTMPQEMMQPSEAEPTLHPEVQEAGVVAVSDVPNLTLEDQKAGIEPAKESVPVSTAPKGVVTLPTQQQAEAVLKKNKVTDSIAWMATLVLRVLKQKEEKHG